jgi:hypothetical protein
VSIQVTSHPEFYSVQVKGYGSVFNGGAVAARGVKLLIDKAEAEWRRALPMTAITMLVQAVAGDSEYFTGDRVVAILKSWGCRADLARDSYLHWRLGNRTEG